MNWLDIIDYHDLLSNTIHFLFSISYKILSFLVSS